MATLKEQLIARAEDWCRRTGYAPSTLGLEVCKDARLLARLKAGGRVSTDVYEAAMAYMDAHPPRHSVKKTWTDKRAGSFMDLGRRSRRKAA